jgi:hypothetical protein
VVWVSADAKVEAVLSCHLDEVPVEGRRQELLHCLMFWYGNAGTNSLVGANASGLEGLGTQLFILVRDHMDAQREVIDGRTLAAQIEDADLRIGHTAVEAGLRVRLVLAVAVATSWTARHCECLFVMSKENVFVVSRLKMTSMEKSALLCCREESLACLRKGDFLRCSDPTPLISKHESESNRPLQPKQESLQTEAAGSKWGS